MKTPIFTGAGTAIVTPYRGGGVDLDKFGELIDFQYAGGVSAIIIGGTTGEAPTLGEKEFAELVGYGVRRINSRMKAVVGIGGNNTHEALYKARIARSLGADAVLMSTPYYNRTNQSGLIKHFSYVADRADIPMILYNIPGRTTIGIALDTYRELSAHPNINGVKEASGEFTLIPRMMAMCGDELCVWSGNDDQTIPMMALGAVGVISVASNIVPSAVSEMCTRCLEGDYKGARDLYYTYAELFAKLFIEVNPIPVKSAMKLMGMDVGELRLPLWEMDEKNLRLLKTAMSGVGLI
ncbi:MAG: 4-hydroxy-tetrahydrodipicolinate synthase [Oscillospiraceae bacterium]|nr:4-hydroxy-tetrahydrodipicolinate synthase [Oscillospiraceae bacterium]